MSVANCDLTEMVRREMNAVGWLILQLIKGESPNALNAFVDKHTQLLTKLNEKRSVVVDPIHSSDLDIEIRNLQDLQAALPTLQNVILNTPKLDAENKLPKEMEAAIQKVIVHDMTLHNLCDWHKKIMECLSWTLLGKKSITHKIDSLCKVIRGYEKKVGIRGLSKDKKDDILIKWKNAKLMLGFLMTFNQAAVPTMGMRMSRKSCMKKGMMYVKRSSSKRNKAYCRKK
jgi:hypothetical protein